MTKEWILQIVQAGETSMIDSYATAEEAMLAAKEHGAIDDIHWNQSGAESYSGFDAEGNRETFYLVNKYGEKVADVFRLIDSGLSVEDYLKSKAKPTIDKTPEPGFWGWLKDFFS